MDVLSDPFGIDSEPLALAELKDRLAADLADMQRLHAASTRLLGETDLDSLLHEILVTAIAITRADMGNMQMLEAETGRLRLRRQVGFERPFIEFFDSVSGGETACGAALESRTRVVIPDVEASPIFRGTRALEVMMQAGARAVQSTPLTSRSGHLLGMISTHYREPHAPEERELRMLDLLARQAADLVERAQTEEALRRSQRELQELTAGLEREVARRTAELERHTIRLRRLAAELTHAEQRERKRLATLVHDHLQQLLVAARMRLAKAQRSTIQPEVVRTLREVEELADRALHAASSVTAELRPPVLHEDGLIATVHWLAVDVLRKYGLTLKVEARDELELEEPVRTLLFECVREAVFNVVKHAGVDTATVRVRREGDFVRVSVVDDGCGFDPARVDDADVESAPTSFGLFSIRERLAAIDGSMRIESVAGHGTRVEMLAPLRAPDRPGPQRRLRLD